MSKVSFDYIRDMPTIRIVVTENCELCDKGFKSLGYLNKLFKPLSHNSQLSVTTIRIVGISLI